MAAIQNFITCPLQKRGFLEISAALPAKSKRRSDFHYSDFAQ
jgi:hypothetical protein